MCVSVRRSSFTVGVEAHDGRANIRGMALATKKLDVHIGDVVEIDGRRYDLVSDKHGGVTLEPAITRTVDEIATRRNRRLSGEEFEELFGDLPADGEG